MGKINKEEMKKTLRDLVAFPNENGTKSPRTICIRDEKKDVCVLNLDKIPTPELGMFIRKIEKGDWDEIFELTRKGQEDHVIMRNEYRIYLGLTPDGVMYRNEPTKESPISETAIGGRAWHSEIIRSKGERY